ncbi:hypothetical protein [Desulfofundulus sp.]
MTINTEIALYPVTLRLSMSRLAAKLFFIPQGLFTILHQIQLNHFR